MVVVTWIQDGLAAWIVSVDMVHGCYRMIEKIPLAVHVGGIEAKALSIRDGILPLPREIRR